MGISYHYGWLSVSSVVLCDPKEGIIFVNCTASGSIMSQINTYQTTSSKTFRQSVSTVISHRLTSFIGLSVIVYTWTVIVVGFPSLWTVKPRLLRVTPASFTFCHFLKTCRQPILSRLVRPIYCIRVQLDYP